MAKKSKTNKKGALYARSATFDPEKGERTFDKQIERVKNYCIANGLTVIDVYRDEGYSGINFNRPGFQRMMTDINEGKINTVIIEDLSRLSRSATDLLKVCNAFKEKNIELLSVAQGKF